MQLYRVTSCTYVAYCMFTYILYVYILRWDIRYMMLFAVKIWVHVILFFSNAQYCKASTVCLYFSYINHFTKINRLIPEKTETIKNVYLHISVCIWMCMAAHFRHFLWLFCMHLWVLLSNKCFRNRIGLKTAVHREHP